MPKPLKKGHIQQPQTIGEHIRNKRLELRLTQGALAQRLNVTSDIIHVWENCKAYPEVIQFPNIILFLGYYPLAHETVSVAGKLQQVRHCNGYTLEALGVLIGVTKSTIYNWEQKKATPNKTMQNAIMVLWQQLPEKLRVQYRPK